MSRSRTAVGLTATDIPAAAVSVVNDIHVSQQKTSISARATTETICCRHPVERGEDHEVLAYIHGAYNGFLP